MEALRQAGRGGDSAAAPGRARPSATTTGGAHAALGGAAEVTGGTDRTADGVRNPLDIVFDAVRRAAGGREGVDVRESEVAIGVAGEGLSEQMTREAIENWVSLGVMRDGNGLVSILPGTVPPTPVVASHPPPPGEEMRAAGGRQSPSSPSSTGRAWRV